MLQSSARSLLLVAVLVAAAGCRAPSGYEDGRCHSVMGGVEPPVAKPASALRVITANMWGIPYISHDVEARFEAMARRLVADRTIDVVGLQEMWADGPREKFMESIATEYPYRADFATEYGSGGLAIASRHPFVGRPQFVPFARAGKWWKPWTGEWLGGKGVGGVQIDAGDSRPWVFVTHLHACYGINAVQAEQGDEYEDYRSDQVRTVRETVNRLAGDGAAIVLGDFNFTARSLYVPMLAEPGPREPFDPGWALVHEPHAPRGRIDDIWLRPGREEVWNAVDVAGEALTDPVALPDGREVGLSDHCPVAAVVAPAR